MTALDDKAAAVVISKRAIEWWRMPMRWHPAVNIGKQEIGQRRSHPAVVIGKQEIGVGSREGHRGGHQ